MFCPKCKGDGGRLVNPDYPMGDCGDREWVPCGCPTVSRREALWREHLASYNRKRFNSPLVV